MDANQMTDEVEDAVEVSSSAMDDFLAAIEHQNFTQAERHFNDMMMDRIQDSLDQRKVQIASQMFNNEPDDDEEDFDDDDLLDDLTDDDLEELFNEVDEDEDEDDEEEDEDDEEEDE